jgi:NAD(P)-dependent dehydrogenase (short-subunit alcohol dehydrogenase family)
MQSAGTAAIITGGASGLGAATAAHLARSGAAVYALDLAASVAQAPSIDGVSYIAADVTDEAQVRAAIEQIDSSIPLRIAVNCAGIAPSMRILGRSGAHDLGLFAKVVQINLVGTFTVLALAAERMAATEPDADGQRGVIVNTASIAGYEGQVGQAAYSSSKGGVIALTLTAARDLAQFGIRVNAIAPGIIETPMIATVSDEFRGALAAGVPFPQRLGRPTEFADLVSNIVQHDYLNGETIRMDGALRMAPR